MKKAIAAGLLTGLLLTSTLLFSAPASAETVTICHEWVLPGGYVWRICHEIEV